MRPFAKSATSSKRALLIRRDGGAFSCDRVRDDGKPLGYWDDTGRRAILKRRMMLLNLE